MWGNPQKYGSEAGVLTPPTAAGGSLPTERLPKGADLHTLQVKPCMGISKAAHALAKSLFYFPPPQSHAAASLPPLNTQGTTVFSESPNFKGLQ